jgi:hypothetical protein
MFRKSRFSRQQTEKTEGGFEGSTMKFLTRSGYPQGL